MVFPTSASGIIVSSTSLTVKCRSRMVEQHTFGSMQMARTMATRCRCPSDDWPGHFCAGGAGSDNASRATRSTLLKTVSVHFAVKRLI
ncbi:hypothetical protein IM737_01930 [Devosia sp. SL43]|nr:hypothetical protein IM737_01930 [Devosia sp. SL43]